ncbi:bifunctional metallophosphatase/5'-nucleotidase [Stieleria tagensis]|uniref:bifunctional metallophosphatase/5'-nucleotidase n=1 Tax=Stieleria tagensis TaxID=2956795 RepID=UPI00209B2173|nr:bifunctional metallophosphatase/5'-nucleotidase [Stieleria tagensis]
MRLESLEKRQLMAADFTLELLHIADQEAAVAAIQDAPRMSAVLTSLRNQDLGNDGQIDNTLTLSSGDAFIPGLFYDASAAAFGSGGIADIQIQNELGIQAIALGNHEFDFGTANLAGLIDGSAPGSILGSDFAGANFPYLSTNLQFATDANLAALEVVGGRSPVPRSVTSSVVLNVNGEDIAVVGATTPTLATISSPDGVGVRPSPFDSNPSSQQLDALALEIQNEVDLLLSENGQIDKVILLAHMQQFDIELGLAARLENVDIIVAGGSNRRLFDGNDRARAGDSGQGDYPRIVTNAGGTFTAVVNTDGSYKYVGRLVIGFDADGNLLPDTYDETVSGAYATDQQGVEELGAAGLVDAEIQSIVDAIQSQIIATESNVFGVSDVFLNGNRSGTETADDPDGVRTQETNLGNLTADANLAEALKLDSSVVVSIKNGGGIRASIGQTIVPSGGSEEVRFSNEAVVDSNNNLIKPAGGISQNDIQTSLAFNNGLALITLTKTELVGLLEHGVSALPGVSGRFPQIAGLKFSYDDTLPAGDRIQSAGVFAENGDLIAKLVERGAIAGDPEQTFRLVTLGFLAAPRFDDTGAYIGGGDGYPFPNTNADPAVGDLGDPDVIARADLQSLDQAGVQTGDAVFADDGTEQDALAEYLKDRFATVDQAFTAMDTGRSLDQRIQNLSYRADTVFPVAGTLRVTGETDSGSGSLREAIQIANDNPGIDRIVFAKNVDVVSLDSAVEYTGRQDLKIQGENVVLRASEQFVGLGLLVSSAAADLVLSKLTIDGDFDEGETPANGIYIPVPAEAQGEISVKLDQVTIRNVGLHGLHIADQINDSDASVHLHVRRSTIVNNGIGQIDYDGIRVDEGGRGDLHADISESQIDGNGGDGLELDERGVGSVYANVSHTSFNDNGFFDEFFDPNAPENAGLEQDLDDGFDIDEADEGGIWASVRRSEAINNFDEGFDFDEAGEGGIVMSFDRVVARDNSDEGIKADEEDQGGIHLSLSRVDLIGNGDDDKSVEVGGGEGIQVSEVDEGNFVANLSRVNAIGNGSQGIKIEEDDEGLLTAFLDRVESTGNGGSGIKIEEAGDGALLARLNRVESNANEGDGVEILESDDGLLFGQISKSKFNDNEDVGIVAEQEGAGFGLLTLRDVESKDNGEGAAELDGVLRLGRLDD